MTDRDVDLSNQIRNQLEIMTELQKASESRIVEAHNITRSQIAAALESRGTGGDSKIPYSYGLFIYFA